MRVIVELVEAGASVSAIARHLNVSRQAVYDWLEKARA
jgi:transposase-like protein